MSVCSRCGEPIQDWDVDTCKITDEEAREFSSYRIKLGDLVCAACFHGMKWPDRGEAPGITDDEG